jgi:hypothetical protein
MAIVYCENSKNGRLNFFVSSKGEDHYLFSSAYSERISEYFSGGVFLDRAIDRSRAGKSTEILRVMDKLPSHLRYVEREYGLGIFKKTRERESRHKRRAA